MVDLSSQYWMARLTVGRRVLLLEANALLLGWHFEMDVDWRRLIGAGVGVEIGMVVAVIRCNVLGVV